MEALPTVCDPNQLKADSRLFFLKSNDPIYKIISDVAKKPTVDRAYDGLSRLASVRGTPSQASTATDVVFDRLAKGFLGCAVAADGSIDDGVGNVDFAPLFAPGHLFEVRGKSGTDPDGGAYQNGINNPFWGVESPPGNSWGTTLQNVATKRLLIYEVVPPDAFLNIPGVYRTDIRTVPVLSAGQVGVNVGLCNLPFDEDPSSFPGGRRVNHNNVYQAYLTLSCSRTQPQAVAAPSPFDPRVLAHRVVDFFAPRTLNAATMFGGLGIVGSGLSDLSPVGVYDLSLIALGSLGPIADGNNTTPLKVSVVPPPPWPYGDSVVVRATSTIDNSPLVGIPIEMSIQGNSSSIAYFQVGNDPTLLPTVIRLTDAAGFANYGDVKLTKAGGYTLNFRVHFIDAGTLPDVIGSGLQVLPSNSFNIQNK